MRLFLSSALLQLALLPPPSKKEDSAQQDDVLSAFLEVTRDALGAELLPILPCSPR